MTSTPDMFDDARPAEPAREKRKPRTARERKLDGIAAVTDKAREETIADLVEFIRTFAATRATPFLAEDIKSAWAQLGKPPPHHSNVWGAVTHIAARRGYITKTGSYRAGESAKNHAHVYAEWQCSANLPKGD